MGRREACHQGLCRHGRTASGRISERGSSGHPVQGECCNAIAGSCHHQCQVCKQQPAGPPLPRFPDERTKPFQTDNFKLDGVDSGAVSIAGHKAMIIRQLQEHVNQCDETPVEVIHDDRPAGREPELHVGASDRRTEPRGEDHRVRVPENMVQ